MIGQAGAGGAKGGWGQGPAVTKWLVGRWGRAETVYGGDPGGNNY